MAILRVAMTCAATLPSPVAVTVLARVTGAVSIQKVGVALGAAISATVRATGWFRHALFVAKSLLGECIHKRVIAVDTDAFDICVRLGFVGHQPSIS